MLGKANVSPNVFHYRVHPQAVLVEETPVSSRLVHGTSLAVQWLRRRSSTVSGRGFDPWSGSCMPHGMAKKKKKKKDLSVMPPALVRPVPRIPSVTVIKHISIYLRGHGGRPW